MAIGAFVTLTPKSGMTETLFDLTKDVIADVRTEPGNLMSVVLRDPEVPDKIFLFEIYRDQAAIDAHRVAPHSVEKGPAVHALLAAPFHTRWFETVEWPNEEHERV